jgi:hypothetical protein
VAVDIGADVDEVVRQVKEAVAAVQAVQAGRASGPAVEVAKVELTLRTVRHRNAGGEVSLRIPLVGQEFGGGATASREELQTIELTLVPPAALPKGPRGWDVTAELVEAILGIEDGVARSAATEPRFDLADAAVELHLVVGRDGRLSLVGTATAAREVTHRVKLYLRPAGR